MTVSDWAGIAALAVGVIGVLVAIIFGIPAWLSWRHTVRQAAKLHVGLAEFHVALGKEIRRLRTEHDLTLEDVRARISPRLSVDDVAAWETDGIVPPDLMGRLMDAIQMSDWDYRTLALNHLSGEEFKTHVEPLMQKGADASLVAARGTWALGDRYSSLQLPIVAARSESLSQFRELSASNYTYIDNLCDRDSLVEGVKLLSRLFPNSRVSLEDSTKYSFALAGRPTVAVGGIGLPGKPNNEFALEVCRAAGIDLTYSEMSLEFAGRTWKSKERDGLLIQDTGLFGRVRSPLDDDSCIMLVQGTHTRGVHGAVLAFSLSPTAMKNHALVAKIAGEREFLCVFDVKIVGGEAVVPHLNADDVFLLPN